MTVSQDMGKSAVVFGATGLVGRALIDELSGNTKESTPLMSPVQ